MNETNLQPFNSETGKIGGQKSGEARRKRKHIRAYLDELLEMAEGETDTNNAAAVAIQILNQAKNGDIKALRLLLEVMGELDRNKTNVTVNNYEKDCQEAYERGRKEEQEYIMSLLPTSVLRQIANGELEPHERTKEELMEIVGLTQCSYHGNIK